MLNDQLKQGLTYRIKSDAKLQLANIPEWCESDQTNIPAPVFGVRYIGFMLL